MHAIMKRPLVDFHPQHFVTVDSKRILNEDEVVGCNAKAMVVSTIHFVRLDAGDNFCTFQGGFSFNVISSFNRGDVHEVVSGLAANRCHHVVNTAVKFFVRMSTGINNPGSCNEK